MSSQNNDGIEYTIQENDKKETSEEPVEQPIPKGNGLNDLPPEVRSQLPESFGQTVNHSDAYIEFLKKHKDSKETTSNCGGFNGHPKDYLEFLAKQNK
jgi:uncharacterized protein YvpB